MGPTVGAQMQLESAKCNSFPVAADSVAIWLYKQIGQ